MGHWVEGVGSPEADRRREVLFAELRCEHDGPLRWKTNAAGMQVLRTQCLKCGIAYGRTYSREMATATTWGWDEEAACRGEARRDEIEAELQLLRGPVAGEDDWWVKYDQYLKTPDWQERRRLVLKRCGGICEGCGKAPAVQVHHLTYANAFAAFLFELAGVCLECHSRLHQDQTQPRANLDG